jgi:hypothetical protein
MTDMALEAVELPSQPYHPPCEMGCGRPAVIIAQGCMDKQPVVMCDECLNRGIEVIKTYVHTYQRVNKRVLICGDCHRPVLRLDTHLDVRRLPT